jgi:branched-chain amino acid transport system permease protein
MGVAGSLVQRYLPPSSSLTAAVLPSIPFLVAAAFLAYNTLRRGRLDETAGVGGVLDRAITPQGGEARPPRTAQDRSARKTPALLRRRAWEPSTLVLIAASGIAVYVINPFWTNYLAQGAAFAVIFLSYTLVTGEGGMIWLCQITFAGVGALTAAQLATNHGWPVPAALVAGGLLAVPIGALLSVLTSRLGQLYIALVTLTFGFLMDQLVFARNVFAQRGLGVTLIPPAFAATDAAMTLFGLAVFGVIAYFTVNIRRSTTGLALNAVRWSEPAARTIGLNPRQSKLLISGVAAFAAAVGGGLLALADGTALPSNYTTLGGIVLLATLVTSGVRSNAGALLAGMTYTLLPALLQVYLPAAWTPVPTLLFGLGAVYIAKNPDGWIPEIGDQLSGGVGYLLRLGRPGAAPGHTLSEAGTAQEYPLSESSRS